MQDYSGTREADLGTLGQTQLAPTLEKGDVVIMDNLAAYKSSTVEKIVRDRDAWILFLPPYSPDLNPIEATRLAISSGRVTGSEHRPRAQMKAADLSGG